MAGTHLAHKITTKMLKAGKSDDQIEQALFDARFSRCITVECLNERKRREVMERRREEKKDRAPIYRTRKRGPGRGQKPVKPGQSDVGRITMLNDIIKSMKLKNNWNFRSQHKG